VSENFFQGENLRSLIGRWRCLCTISFLEASLLEKLDFWCCIGCVSTIATRNNSLQRDFFSFCNSSSFYFGCVHPYCRLNSTLLQRLGDKGIVDRAR
jgi:hypothetical protein